MLRMPGAGTAAARPEIGALPARHVRQGQGSPALEEGGVLPNLREGVGGKLTQGLRHADTGSDGPVW